MASEARKAFDVNADGIERLLELHQIAEGAGRGRKHQLEVFNKSAIVLITSIWGSVLRGFSGGSAEILSSTNRRRLKR